MADEHDAEIYYPEPDDEEDEEENELADMPITKMLVFDDPIVRAALDAVGCGHRDCVLNNMIRSVMGLAFVYSGGDLQHAATALAIKSSMICQLVASEKLVYLEKADYDKEPTHNAPTGVQ